MLFTSLHVDTGLMQRACILGALPRPLHYQVPGSRLRARPSIDSPRRPHDHRHPASSRAPTNQSRHSPFASTAFHALPPRHRHQSSTPTAATPEPDPPTRQLSSRRAHMLHVRRYCRSSPSPHFTVGFLRGELCGLRVGVETRPSAAASVGELATAQICNIVSTPVGTAGTARLP